MPSLNDVVKLVGLLALASTPALVILGAVAINGGWR